MANEYTVRSVNERTRLTRSGTLEVYYRVEATTAGGTDFTLDLNEDQSAEETARELLKAKAVSLDKLLQL